MGVGPSSSHTVGPMRAGYAFVKHVQDTKLIERVARITVTLYGSLSLTGLGHGTDRAVMAGLEGNLPDTVDTDHMFTIVDETYATGTLTLLGGHRVAFDYKRDVIFEQWKRMVAHPNGMRFIAYDEMGAVIDEQVWYSIGGGFIRQGTPEDAMIGLHADQDDASGATAKSDENAAKNSDDANDDEARNSSADLSKKPADACPYPFTTCDELMALCEATGKTISQIVWANELYAHHGDGDYVRKYLLNVWHVMQDCVQHGCNCKQPILPGGLEVPRRAPKMYHQLAAYGDVLADAAKSRSTQALQAHDSAWLNLFALAVSEENAGGGRIVTAPTNGSAGIIPAVLHYYWHFVPEANEDGVVRFLLAAGAIGYLFKRNASISGAEVGCQGEVGSACSMAAAGLCEVLGGVPRQVENAAEIGIEHHLGLTCDPVAGLVQIPCIERNAMASNTALNAVRIAMLGDGSHMVSLDKAIKTMKETGHDMMSKYRETSKGGLAVNVVEC